MGRKTRWKKEKLLVLSNFSFSHSVFKRLELQNSRVVWERVKDPMEKFLQNFGNACVHHFIFSEKRFSAFQIETSPSEQFLLFRQFFPPFLKLIIILQLY